MSLIEDSLLVTKSSITHHNEAIRVEEKLSPTLEDLGVLTWLRLIHTSSVVS